MRSRRRRCGRWSIYELIGLSKKRFTEPTGRHSLAPSVGRMHTTEQPAINLRGWRQPSRTVQSVRRTPASQNAWPNSRYRTAIHLAETPGRTANSSTDDPVRSWSSYRNSVLWDPDGLAWSPERVPRPHRIVAASSPHPLQLPVADTSIRAEPIHRLLPPHPRRLRPSAASLPRVPRARRSRLPRDRQPRLEPRPRHPRRGAVRAVALSRLPRRPALDEWSRSRARSARAGPMSAAAWSRGNRRTWLRCRYRTRTRPIRTSCCWGGCRRAADDVPGQLATGMSCLGAEIARYGHRNSTPAMDDGGRLPEKWGRVVSENGHGDRYVDTKSDRCRRLQCSRF